VSYEITRREFLKMGGALVGGSLLAFSTRDGGIIRAVGGDPRAWVRSRELPSFKRPHHLDYIDATDVDPDVQLVLTTMQGAVAQERPAIYVWFPTNEPNHAWIDTLGVPYTEHTDPWEVIRKHSSKVKGVIVYDPELMDTINVATTLAGLQRAVVASPQIAQELSGEPYNLPIIDDLRGRFTSKLEAYQWQYDHLWPQCNHDVLTGISPSQRRSLPPGIPPYYTTLAQVTTHVHDSSNRGVYEFDLTPFLGGEAVYLRFDDAFTDDGWGPSVQHVTVIADGQTIADFQPFTDAEAQYLYDSDGSSRDGSHRFADGTHYFVYRFVPPQGTTSLTARVEMWNEYKVSATSTTPPTSDVLLPFPRFRDYIVAARTMVFWLDPNVDAERELFVRIMSEVDPYTPYMGWFAQDVAGEFSGTQLCSEHSVYVLAADFFDNGTVFGAVRAPMPPRRPPAKPTLENKIYVALVMSEGDNIQYDQHRMRQLWDDPSRGKIPINWTVNPILFEAAPTIIGYYLRTATDNDLLMAGPSGAGYINPTPWPDDTFRIYTHATYRYMHRLGMNTVYVLNRVNGRSVGLSASERRAYIEDVKPEGIMLNWDARTAMQLLDGTTPQGTVRGTGNAADVLRAITEESQGWDGSSPLFLSIGVLAWNVTPTDLVNTLSTLGPEYEIVRADHFFELARQYYQSRG